MSDDDERPESQACVLVISDECNPFLQDLKIFCSSLREAVEVSSRINMKFPMCEHGRLLSIEHVMTADDVDEMFEDIDQQITEQRERVEQHKHQRIMGFISNVSEGKMIATLDGQEIDAFQLSAMDEEELADVEFQVTSKGHKELMEQGVEIREFRRGPDGQWHSVDPVSVDDEDEDPEG